MAMKKRTVAAALFTLALGLTLPGGSGTLRALPPAPDSAAADSRATLGSQIDIIVTRAAGPVEVDGVLEEEAWRRAEVYEDYFFQQEPLDREPSSQQTRLMVIQDDQHLYVGAICYEQDPAKIFATVKRRDGNFLADDAFELLIDTFRDYRNSYAFGTNPFGAMIDAIISDEGNHINKSWDCVWRCKTRVHDRGWSIEMAIPFKSIKYKEGDGVDWGLNITREIKHSKEVTYLAPIPRGLGHNGKFKGSLYVNLKNIHTPRQSLNLELKPYLTSGRTVVNEPRSRDNSLDGGVDLRYNVTPQLALDFSYQTDFAQAEAEQEVVNVDRFNVNLPEKREFFLESAGMFSFGSGTQAGGSLVGVNTGSSYKLFESRTIGIRGDRRIPLLGGAKLAGRVGRYSIGVLNMQSEETGLEGGLLEPSANFTAVKLKRDLFTNSNVGMMVLNRRASSGDWARALGGETFLAFSPEFFVNGTLARSWSEEIDRLNWAGDIGAVMNKDWIDAAVRYTRLDTLFQPEMGFVTRGNIRTLNGTVSVTKWINDNRFKSLSLIADNEYTTDSHRTLVNRENRANFQLTLASEDFLYYGLHRRFDFLPGPDYIDAGPDRQIMLGQGGYGGFHHHLEFNSYRARKMAGSVHYRWGDSYDGRTRALTVTNDTKLSSNLNVDLEWSHNRLDYLNGALTANVLATRWTYSFTTELFAKAYVQWNDLYDRVSTNLLIDYIYRPKSHIYLVFNNNRHLLSTTGEDQLLPDSRHINDWMVMLKLTYLYGI